MGESCPDYTGQHIPSDEQMDAMVDDAFADGVRSAMLLARWVDGGWEREPGRRWHPAPRLETPQIDMAFDPRRVVSVAGPPTIVPMPRIAPPPVTRNPLLIDRTIAAAAAEPPQVGPAEGAVIASGLEVIREWVRRIAETAAMDNDIVKHALASIELGVVGLAKVMEHGRTDASG